MADVLRLPDVPAALAWLRERVAGDLATDSRKVGAGDAFIAWPGYARDGREFVPQALAAGAAACLIEAEGSECFSFEHDGRVAALAGLKAATGALADAFYGHPSRAIDLIATTGTNGKTSTAWWTAQALSLLEKRCGVIGTLGIGEPPTALRPAARVDATGLTTPDPVTLHRALRRFANDGFAAAAVEASSIGIVEQRLGGVHLRVALYTNFTPDHLDYHGDMAAYWAAKRQLFAWPGLGAAVVNLDDAQGAGLADELARAGGPDLWTYAIDAPARLQALAVHHGAEGLAFTVREDGRDVPVRTRLIGQYNVSNVLAVFGGLRALGVSLDDAARVASDFTPVPGRMQRVVAPASQPQVVVDYAHTPDALEKALQALRPFAQARGGRLWCVFGCGGNRDTAKRPVMGGLAMTLADRVIVTSDNPRNEAPEVILSQILWGCDGATHVVAEVDRRKAIDQAVCEAAPQDVVLIAGKGHEDYQEIAGVKHPFSDVEQAAAALARREGRAC
jgi:UDP-N-acetylmuramoyl-L-alanyl-D-glutamate--2,6-diaminopimelate ligase